ncbi:hypothetical protein COU76_00800 [Candidatus Peregrinibacteria bacterium CG10_big_fil_rev_8_21_14_0_10_49_10]|nr:MAG: hypothetical protein COU76_00800 [Candidatus Peregrinibacteria bacterium CG10_big_fil_rev_8_21_14_0_10_49_10]
MKKVLTQRLLDAIALAVEVHAGMKCKGDDSPYIVHPIAISLLLAQWGADEDTCIAGLLHDVLEDTPQTETDTYRKRIREKCGATVLEIVEDVSEQDKSLPWKERKLRYLEHLKEAPKEALLVSCADKTHNSMALCKAYKEQGSAVWNRFSAPREEKLWYLNAALEIFTDRLDEDYTAELRENLRCFSLGNTKQLIALVRTEGKTTEQILQEASVGVAPHLDTVNENFTVFIADNFHYMDDSPHIKHGTFATLEEAIEACEHITIWSVMDQYEEGISPEKLTDKYRTFGSDPYIVGPNVRMEMLAAPFSAWISVSVEFCAQIIQIMKNGPLAKQKSKNFFLDGINKSPDEVVDILLKRFDEMSEE